MTSSHTFYVGSARFTFDPTDNEPIRIRFNPLPLHMAIIRHEQLWTSDEWNQPGIYFLIGPGEGPASYRVYVGKAASVAKRIDQHRTGKEFWAQALVVTSDRSRGFTETDITWLEAYFITKFYAEIGQHHIDNKVKTSSNPLHDDEERDLEALAAPIEAMLRLLGMLTPDAEPEDIESDEPESRSIGEVEYPSVSHLTWVQAACEVLADAGGPLHASIILEDIVARGLRDVSNAKTPANTLRRDLRTEAQKNDGLIIQTGPSIFNLRRPS